MYIEGKTQIIPNKKYTINSISQLLKLILTKKAITNKQYKNIININKTILSNFFVFNILNI